MEVSTNETNAFSAAIGAGRSCLLVANRKVATIEDHGSVFEAGSILTRIEMCSICGTDVHLWQGSRATKVELPVILGHEMVGRIVALGAGAGRDSVGHPLRIGDRITWAHTSCGSCFFCTVAQEPTLCQNSRRYMYEMKEWTGFHTCSVALPSTGMCYPTLAGFAFPTTFPMNGRVSPVVRCVRL